MKLNKNDYKEKVLGCWLGKNIGGTVGAPFEWQRQINNIAFYTQLDLNGQPMPNDDLDIQLLWLCALEEKGIHINSATLAEYWCLYVTPHWSEYGTAKINMRQGLQPPFSGSFQNVYKHSCGAYIRSEIWACIAPALPHLAAEYAYEDAILDHGDGEGVFAEVFMAAMESAAFACGNLRTLVDIGLSYIPEDCGTAAAVHTMLKCFEEGRTWLETRDELLRRHRGACDIRRTSERDRKLGFHEGVLGYDVPSNIALTLSALFYGGDDFAAVQCTAVNCGEDTDCTAATAGALWGIMRGAAAIPEKWIAPIGRGIRTVCLNLGELGAFGSQLPQTVDELAHRTMRIARQVLLRHGSEHLCGDEPTDLSDADPQALMSKNGAAALLEKKGHAKFDFDFFTVFVDYGPEGPVIRNGQPKKIRITVANRYKTQANLALRWHLPEGWRILPGPEGYLLSLPRHIAEPAEAEFVLTAERVNAATNRAVLEITIAGRPTVMTIPAVLLNGNLIA